MECIFCKIVAGELPSHRVYEDETTLAFLDINPATRGHTLVIPRQHAPDLFELPDDLLAVTAHATQKVAQLLQRKLRPDGVNVVQSNGAAAGQVIFHYHVHLIPRWADDRAFRLWHPGETDHAALGALAADLRASEGS